MDAPQIGELCLFVCLFVCLLACLFVCLFVCLFKLIHVWTLSWVEKSSENITIHHECPCGIEISHPRGRNFNQGRGLPSPWVNSDSEGEISLSYMDRLMMDCFSPTFPRFFFWNIKHKKT